MTFKNVYPCDNLQTLKSTIYLSSSVIRWLNKNSLVLFNKSCKKIIKKN